MYIPKAFNEPDTGVQVAFMRAHSLAIVVSTIDGTPFATHAPVFVRAHEDANGARIELAGHFALANPQARMMDDTEVLVIFSGPNAYVSPSLYEEREAVPTWNYMAVHAYGIAKTFTAKLDAAKTERLLRETIDVFEPAYAAQWETLSETYRNARMRELVGFNVAVSRLEGKFKLSQNRPLHDRQNVAESLSKSNDPSAAEVGKCMKQRLP